MKKQNTDESFYAVLVEETIYIPGDERSRSNPGHGYPAHNESHNTLIEFDTVAEFREWIESNDANYGKKAYRALYCKPVKIEKIINFSHD